MLGGTGMLGHRIVREFSKDFKTAITIRGGKEQLGKFAPFYQNSDIYENVHADSIDQVEKVISHFEPDVVINCIGIIKQIKEAKDYVVSLEINSVFPHRLSQLSSKYNFRMIHLSTDCVFDGVKGGYSEEDAPNPPDLYGKSKLLGEVPNTPNVLTLRTSIIGRELFTEKSLIEWFLSQDKLNGYRNAVFSGFPTLSLAKIIREILINYKELSGVYHISSDPIDKHTLLEMINKKYKLGKEITPIDEPKINRSLDSTQLKSKIDFKSPSWEALIQELDILDDAYGVRS